ncbi:MAG TPA: DNA adenine methylase [Pseudonocardiaceae bacterium]
MSIRYIGSKARVAERIADIVGPPVPGCTFVDGMVGSGSVARAVAERGWNLRINDHLLSSVTVAAARVTAAHQVPFSIWGGYDPAIIALNAAPPRSGVIHREYSPASAATVGHERRYFTEDNAMRIDGIRAEIARWAGHGLLARAEERLLLADLLRATNAVANTAGTYGCYLRHWSPVAMRTLTLSPRPLLTEAVEVQTTTMDVLDIPVAGTDIAYYDPPYTKRQYAAYYHVLETISYGDEPSVGGVTGLRPWTHLASKFCYQRHALDTIRRLIESCPARRILLSYSDDGHVRRDTLIDAVGALGTLTVHELGHIGRYRPNVSARAAAPTVAELLLDLHRSPLPDTHARIGARG